MVLEAVGVDIRGTQTAIKSTPSTIPAFPRYGQQSGETDDPFHRGSINAQEESLRHTCWTYGKSIYDQMHLLAYQLGLSTIQHFTNYLQAGLQKLCHGLPPISDGGGGRPVFQYGMERGSLLVTNPNMRRINNSGTRRRIGGSDEIRSQRRRKSSRQGVRDTVRKKIVTPKNKNISLLRISFKSSFNIMSTLHVSYHTAVCHLISEMK